MGACGARTRDVYTTPPWSPPDHGGVLHFGPAPVSLIQEI
jgi:hypothetical protein